MDESSDDERHRTLHRQPRPPHREAAGLDAPASRRARTSDRLAGVRSVRTRPARGEAPTRRRRRTAADDARRRATRRCSPRAGRPSARRGSSRVAGRARRQPALVRLRLPQSTASITPALRSAALFTHRAPCRSSTPRARDEKWPSAGLFTVSRPTEVGPASARADAVEEDRLLDRGPQRVADARPLHGMSARTCRPARAAARSGSGSAACTPRRGRARGRPRGSAASGRRRRPGGHERVRRRVACPSRRRARSTGRSACAMCVSSVGIDLRDHVEVAVDELAAAAGCPRRRRAPAAPDVELEAREAERVLDVDADEADRKASSRAGTRSCSAPTARPRPRAPRRARARPRRRAPGRSAAAAAGRASVDELEPRVRAGSARPTFADGRPSVITMSPVKSFSPRISDEPTPYESTGTPRSSKARIFSTVKPPETTIFTRSKPSRSSASRTFSTEPLVDAARVEVAHLVPERAVDELAGRVEPHAPEPRAERAGDLERGAHGVVLEVDQHDDVEVVRRPLGELRRSEHGVAAVRGDQRVRDGADAAAAPPGRLRVGRHPDLRRRCSAPATYAA